MIVCIDLKEYDCGMSFSFFNTVDNSYLMINGNQSWDSIRDLVDDFEVAKVFYNKELQERLIGKIPEWVPAS